MEARQRGAVHPSPSHATVCRASEHGSRDSAGQTAARGLPPPIEEQQLFRRAASMVACAAEIFVVRDRHVDRYASGEWREGGSHGAGGRAQVMPAKPQLHMPH